MDRKCWKYCIIFQLLEWGVTLTLLDANCSFASLISAGPPLEMPPCLGSGIDEKWELANSKRIIWQLMAKEDNPLFSGFLSLHDLFWRGRSVQLQGLPKSPWKVHAAEWASDAKLMGDINIWMNLNIFQQHLSKSTILQKFRLFFRFRHPASHQLRER